MPRWDKKTTPTSTTKITTIVDEPTSTEDISLDTIVISTTTDVVADAVETDSESVSIVGGYNISDCLDLVGQSLYANGYTNVVAFPSQDNDYKIVNKFDKSFNMVAPRSVKEVSKGFIDNGPVITGYDAADVIGQYNVNATLPSSKGSAGRVWYSSAIVSVSDLINALETADAMITHKVKVLRVNLNTPAIRSALCDIQTRYNPFSIVQPDGSALKIALVIMFNNKNIVPAFYWDLITPTNPNSDMSLSDFWAFHEQMIVSATNVVGE